MSADGPINDGSLFDDVRDALRGQSHSGASHKTAPPEVDNYTIVREIHRGGQGIVYEAIQRNPERRVALKVLLHGNFSSPAERQRFEREVRWISSVTHPGIVTIYDSGFVEGQPFYSMELIDGLTLSADKRFQRSEPANATAGQEYVRRCVRLVIQICQAVSCFQRRGLIHRDLKPGNILLDAAGQPHIVDFGLARRADPLMREDEDPLTQSGEFLGTLAYASPEQLSGHPELVDSRTDVYALGVILYELVAGSLPHHTDDSTASIIQRICNEDALPPSRKNRTIPRDVDTMILKAMSREPDRRYQSADQLAADLERFLDGRPIDARRDSTLYVLTRVVQRHRYAVLGGLAFLILLIAFAVTSFGLWRNAQEQLERALTAEASAEKARQDEQHQREEAEFMGASAALAAALSAVREFRITDAHDYLHRIPKRLRGFEWNYAISRTDCSIETWNFPAAGLVALRLSADGRLVAMGGLNGIVCIADARSGDVEFRKSACGRVTAVALHPDGQHLVVGTDDGRLRVLDTVEDRWLRTLRSSAGGVIDVRLSRDGKTLAVCSGLYPSEQFECSLRKFETDADIIRLPKRSHALCFNADGSQLAAVGEFLQVVDVAAGRIKATSDRLPHWQNDIVFGHDDRTVLTAGIDQKVTVFDSRTASPTSDIRVQEATTRGLALHPDGAMFATSAADGSVRLWDLETGELIRVLFGHTSWAEDVLFMPDGRRLLSVDTKAGVKVWSATAETGDFRRVAHTSSVYDACHNSTGSQLVTCSFSSEVHLWNTTTGRKIKSLRGHSASVHDVEFSRDDRTVASASVDGSILVHNLDGTDPWKFSLPDEEFLCVAFSPDERSLAAGTKSGRLIICDRDSGESVIDVVCTTPQPVRRVWFVPNEGQLLLEQPESMEVRSTKDGTIVRHWAKPRNTWHAAAAMHPDQAHIAVGDDSGRIQLWDIATGQSMAAFEWHEMGVSAIAFSPAGDRLFAASVDGAIKIWHTQRRVELVALPSPNQTVYQLSVSPDGRRIAGALHDRTMIWWEAVASKIRIGKRLR